MGPLSACRRFLPGVLRTCPRSQAQLMCLCPLTAWTKAGQPLLGIGTRAKMLRAAGLTQSCLDDGSKASDGGNLRVCYASKPYGLTVMRPNDVQSSPRWGVNCLVDN